MSPTTSTEIVLVVSVAAKVSVPAALCDVVARIDMPGVTRRGHVLINVDGVNQLAGYPGGLRDAQSR